MKAINGLTEEQIADRFYLFLEEYEKDYKTEAFEYIKEHFWDYINEYMCPDILMQVYSEIGAEPIKGTYYNTHLHNIERLFGLDKNIIEVASGMIPAFANKIAARQQKLQKGTITIYDPLLLRTTSRFPHMTIHKEPFSRTEDLSSYDLIAGLLTCEATEEMIVSACEQRKDFYIAMCGCDHIASSNPFYMTYVPGRYINHIINLAKKLMKENDNGTLEIKYLNKKFDCEYPILYNRKK